MKKIITFISILFIVFIIGCTNKPHFEGIILEVNEGSIAVGTGNVDAEAQYPTYEIKINQTTQISGKVQKLSDLQRDQRVKIRVENEKTNGEINNKVAVEIIVE